MDACSAWAEQNKQTVAIAILDWGGNLIESHAMEGAPMKHQIAMTESHIAHPSDDDAANGTMGFP